MLTGLFPAPANAHHGIRTWEQAALTGSIAQTTDGFVWFASLAGLHRFDGSTLAPAVPGLVTAARVLLATRDGRLWVATGGGYLDVAGGDDGGARYEVSYREGGGGLIVIEAGQPTVVLPADGNPEHWVWSLAELPDGRVVAGTEDGLQIIARNATLRVRVAHQPGAGDPIAALHQDGARTWIGTAQGLMSWEEGGEVVPAGMEGPVRALAAARGGGVWVVMDRELAHTRDGRRGETFPAPAGSFLRSALAHPDGSTWLGTTTGLFRRAAAGWERVDARLPEQTVRSLMVDREGSTWISIKGLGVAQLHDTTVINVGRPEGMPTDGVLSVLRVAEDRVWASTTAGLVEVAGLTVRPRFLPGADDWSLRNLARTPGGDLWLGFDRLVRRRGDVVTRYATVPAEGSLRALWVADDGMLWAGWAKGGVTRYPGGEPGADGVFIGAPEGVCAGPVEFITGGQSGNVWLGGPRGVTRVTSDGTRAKCFALDKVGAFRPLGLAELTNGTAWITGVGSTGLIRLRGDQGLAIERNGFPGTSLYGVLSDGQGRFWFSSNRGVFRAAVTDLEALAEERHASVEIHQVDAHSGMRSQDCASTFAPALAPWAEGGVVVPTALGLSFIAPPERRARPVVRPIIESLQVDGVVPAPPELQALRPRPRAIELRFAVPTFLPGTDLAVEYALHRSGQPTPWIAAAAARVARFEDLPAGAYAFEVRARDNQTGGGPSGFSFAHARLTFRVLAPWWEWQPLRAGAVAALILLAFAIHRARLRRLRARFELIQNERARIARELHDGLAQLFVGVGYQLQALQRQVGEGQPTTTELLKETREMVRAAQGETKRALWNLRAGFERGDLARSLAGIVAQARTQLPVTIDLRTTGDLPNSGILDHEVPRIVQEALTNAVRHGGAKTIAVTVARAADGLTVTIDDDGSGMAAAPAENEAPGMGTAGMRERAASASGVLTVTNRDGVPGVRVRLAIPDEALRALEDPARETRGP